MNYFIGLEFILNIFVIFSVNFINVCVSVEVNTDETVLQTCQKFLQTNPEKLDDVSFWGNPNNGHFRREDGIYRLDNHVKFYTHSPIWQNNDITSLCVSVDDTTTFSYIEDSKAAFATFITRTEIPAGIINVTTWCWRRSKNVNDCEPAFMAMPGFMDSALFNYSPLNEEFWNHVQDETIFRRNWIWRINVGALIGSISASWIPRLSIVNLTELRIRYNDWRRPDVLFGSLPNLEVLDLSDNNIEILPDGTLEKMPQLVRVDLGNNNFYRLPNGVEKLNRIDMFNITNPRGDAILTLSNEEIQTLTKVKLLNFDNTKIKGNISALLNLPNVWFLNLGGSFVGNIEDDVNIKLSYKSKLSDLQLSFNNLSKLPKTTLSRLVSLERFYLNDNSIEDCSDGSLSSLVSLKELYLYKNNIKMLNSECFSELRVLETLDLSKNQISVIGPLTFQNVTNLRKLHLSHNNISFIPQQFLQPLRKLKFLDLSFNHLIQIPTLNSEYIENLNLGHNLLTQYLYTSPNPKYIQSLDLSENRIQEFNFQNVAILNLSYNSLTHIPAQMWEYLQSPSIKTVDLYGNEFDCCHSNASYLQKMINTSHQFRNLSDNRLFTCSLDDGQKVLFATFQYNSSICLESDLSLDNRKVAIEIGIAILILTAVVSVTTAVLYYYRTELTYISHLFKMKKRGWEKDEEQYNVCHYDAFVCYSGKDLKWVLQQLLPNLESESSGYRLCLHDRDFTIGAAIDTNVVASLEKSRKVIFVLTEDFIGSKWCQWELEMANHKMFEEDRGYIILIELERLDKKNLPRHLRYLMDTRTYLEWPDDVSEEQKVLRCWNRLKYALGDSILKRTGRSEPRGSVLDIRDGS